MDQAIRGKYGIVYGALSESACRALLDEIDSSEFQAMDPYPGGGNVEQRGEKLELSLPSSDHPVFQALAISIGDGAKALIGDDGQFVPNSVFVQRYAQGKVGVSPHRDSKQFVRLIVIATLEGEAEFTLHEVRDGQSVESFGVGPGDVVVLPTTGPTRSQASLLFHAVSGARTARRVSATFRQRL